MGLLFYVLMHIEVIIVSRDDKFLKSGNFSKLLVARKCWIIFWYLYLECKFNFFLLS